jgi:hypothetical protein
MTRVKLRIDALVPGHEFRFSQALGQAVIVRSSPLSLNRQLGSSNEFRMMCGKFDRGLRRVVGDPFGAAARCVVDEAHDAVGGNEVGVRRNEGRIGLELCCDVRLGVTRVENDHDPIAWANACARPADHFRRDGVSLDEGNGGRKLVRFDGAAVVRTDLDIDADDPPRSAHRLEQRRVEDQRAPVRDAGLDDDVGPQVEDHLLQPDEILRVLDDRAAEPGESIGIFLVPADLEPELGNQLECLFA